MNLRNCLTGIILASSLLFGNINSIKADDLNEPYNPLSPLNPSNPANPNSPGNVALRSEAVRQAQRGEREENESDLFAGVCSVVGTGLITYFSLKRYKEN